MFSKILLNLSLQTFESAFKNEFQLKSNKTKKISEWILIIIIIIVINNNNNWNLFESLWHHGQWNSNQLKWMLKRLMIGVNLK